MKPADLRRRIAVFSCLCAIAPLSASIPAIAQYLPPQYFPTTNNNGVYSPVPTDQNLTMPTQQTSPDINQNRIPLNGPSSNVNSSPSSNVYSNESNGQNDVQFPVSRIEVSGNTLISDDEIHRLIGPYEAHPISASELSTLVNQINEDYHQKGYLTSVAFVPPQDLNRGAISIRILEGMIGEMDVTGNKYLKAKVVSNRISENPGDPLNVPKLEKELLQINRTEPYHLTASLTPGDNTGETNVHFDVQEQQPLQVALTSDNAGRPGLGIYRYGAELLDRNVSGYGDRLSLGYMMGTHQELADAAYSVPVGKYGTEITGLFGFSHVNVDLKSLDIHNEPPIVGNAYNYSLVVSQPLDREKTWVTDLSFNARQADDFYGNQQTETDAVRSVAAGLNFDKYDPLGRTYARVQATVAPEWLGANTHFFKLEDYLTRVIRLPLNNLFIARAYSQWSPDALPPIEEFQLGGENSVRGYTQGLLMGDKGYDLGAEWRWPIPFLGHVSPWLADRLQGAFFFDYGQTWLSKDSNRYIVGVSNSSEYTSLMGTGVGLRAHLTDYLQGYVDFAFGLLNRHNIIPGGQPDMMVHFGVRSELLSNEYKSRSTRVTPIKTNIPPHQSPQSVGMLQQADLQSDVSEPVLEPVDHVATP